MTLTDIDGNTYNAEAIGAQMWMTSNLKTTKYNDGTSITRIDEPSYWNNLNDAPVRPAAYTWYNDDPGSCILSHNNQVLVWDNVILRHTGPTKTQKEIGCFYNWSAVNTGKLAPEGWHVPTKADWEILIEEVGGDEAAWAIFPGSTFNGQFYGIGLGPDHYGVTHPSAFYWYGVLGVWWSSTLWNAKVSHTLSINSSSPDLNTGQSFMNWGCNVRCVKDS